MRQTVYGRDEEVIAWVAPRLDERPDHFEGCTAIGLERDGELIAGVIYNFYTGSSISMNCAAIPGRMWLNRDFLFRVFAYPFIQLGCRRVTSFVRADNLDAMCFNLKLGFRIEGRVRQGCEDGTDMWMLGMLRNECRFLEPRK